MKKIGIIMGSKSDLPVVEKTINQLKEFGIPVVVRILSAHRTPDEVAEFARNARQTNIGVIIAAAGKAAALPGCIAGITTLPVIGLPIRSSFLDGLDSILSMIQMPPGVPVATVGTDAGLNAAILAAQILSVYDSEIEEKLNEYKQKMKSKVIADDNDINCL